jgi:hypothetical protein
MREMVKGRYWNEAVEGLRTERGLIKNSAYPSSDAEILETGVFGFVTPVLAAEI